MNFYMIVKVVLILGANNVVNKQVHGSEDIERKTGQSNWYINKQYSNDINNNKSRVGCDECYIR